MAFNSISSINGAEEECLDPSHETNLTATNQYDVDGVCREAIKRSAVRPSSRKTRAMKAALYCYRRTEEQLKK